MAALACDICGGKLVMGTGGVATCDSCGMEHSTDRMREKVQEVRGKVSIEGKVQVGGSVEIDQQKNMENFFFLAEQAMQAKDWPNALLYAGKAIEVKHDEYIFWKIKSMATIAGTTLNDFDSRSQQATAATLNAVTFAPHDLKNTVAEDCCMHIWNYVEAALTQAMGMPITHGTAVSHSVISAWLRSVETIPNLSLEFMEGRIAELRDVCLASKQAFMPGARYIYSAYFSFNKNERYDLTLAKILDYRMLVLFKESDPAQYAVGFDRLVADSVPVTYQRLMSELIAVRKLGPLEQRLGELREEKEVHNRTIAANQGGLFGPQASARRSASQKLARVEDEISSLIGEIIGIKRRDQEPE